MRTNKALLPHQGSRMPALLAACMLLLAATPVGAQTPTCDALTGSQQELAQSLLASQYCYACCDDTIAKCIETAPQCALPVRLADFVCRLASEGKDEMAIVRALEKRALSMLDEGDGASIELRDEMRLGDPDAPVVLVAYLCARCPFCANFVPKLTSEVTTGKLAGRVRLYVRVFPIKSHKDGTSANLALEAAARQGKFWEFLLYSYDHFDAYSVDSLPDWAEAAGLSRDKFLTDLDDKDVRDTVVDSKKEGLKNGVDGTPAFFVNGHKLTGGIDLETLIDVSLETYDEAVSSTSGGL